MDILYASLCPVQYHLTRCAVVLPVGVGLLVHRLTINCTQTIYPYFIYYFETMSHFYNALATVISSDGVIAYFTLLRDSIPTIQSILEEKTSSLQQEW